MDNSVKDIPYVAYESGLDRLERSNKRSHLLNLVLCILLLCSWIGFFVYESQFETVAETTTTQEVMQDTENGDNQFVGGDYYGEADNTHS